MIPRVDWTTAPGAVRDEHSPLLDTSGKRIVVMADDALPEERRRIFEALARNHGDKVGNACVTVVWMKDALSRVEMHPGEATDYPDAAGATEIREDGRTGRSVAVFGYWNRIDTAMRECGVDRATATQAAEVVLTAQAFGADIIATDNPVLVNAYDDYNAFVPADALALVGLYLRKRGVNIITSNDGFPTQTSRFTALSVALDHLIPNLFILQQGSIGKHEQGEDFQTVPHRLALSARTRLYRMMLARDLLHESFHRNATRGGAEDAAFALDTLMLNLVGAFDALARLANDVYGLGLKPGKCGWQFKKPFRKELRNHGGGDLADAAAAKEFQDTFELLRQLRNSIHGEALDTQTFEFTGDERDRYPLTLLGQDALDLVECAERVGGPAAWGLSDWTERFGVQVQADTFAERAVEEAVKHLKVLTDAFDLKLLHNTENANFLIDRSPLRGWGPHIGQGGVEELVAYAGIGGSTGMRKRAHK